jgi:hypothetical protein
MKSFTCLLCLVLLVTFTAFAQQPVLKNTAVKPVTADLNTISKPAFKANATYLGGEPIAANTETKIHFSGVVFDEGKNFSADEFVAPSDGIYHFDLRVSWLQFSAEGYVTLAIRTNLYAAVAASSVQISSKTLAVFDSNFSTLLKLKAGDRISVHLTQQTGSQQKYQQVQLCGFKVN